MEVIKKGHKGKKDIEEVDFLGPTRDNILFFKTYLLLPPPMKNKWTVPY